ncbi:MAG: peptidoglycan editing factor PgeF [Bacteroidota bacterium]
MQKTIHKRLPLWRFDHFSKFSSIIHYISGREGGISDGNFESLNLSFSVSDEKKNVQENRKRLADELQIGPETLLFPWQTHSGNIKIIVNPEEKRDNLGGTDGIITNLPGLCISVLTADCVPITFYDPSKQVIGVVHSGWRGTVKGIAGKMAQTFISEFNSKPSDILVGIGPSIGPDTYEVGKNVIDEVKNTFGKEAELILQEEKKNKAYLNLWKANRILLEHAGIPSENIETAYICTYTDQEYFFSARRLGKDCGRYGAGIMLKEN